MKRCMLIFCVLIVLISSNFVSAHQPRLVFDKTLSQENPFQIQNPEISQAFYSQLKGNPEYFIINSDKNFNLYIQILSPYIKDARKDFSVEITGKENFRFNGTNYQWVKFYEEFAGDNYWQGPAIEKSVESGTYLIKVYNPDNLGKYVLVVGKKESFPMNEAINAIKSLPKLKIYFNKSPLTAFFNLIGLSLAIIVVVFITLILIIVLIIIKISGARKPQPKKKTYHKKKTSNTKKLTEIYKNIKEIKKNLTNIKRR